MSVEGAQDRTGKIWRVATWHRVYFYQMLVERIKYWKEAL
jgi:hypothetical protein